MAKPIKPTVEFADTFEKLDVRLGRIVEVAPEPSSPKPAYRLVIDFGKFGRRVSVGRFTQHDVEDLQGQLVLGVLNFPPRQVGDVTSEVLTLGVQYPKADSGEATPVAPLVDAKLGSKLF